MILTKALMLSIKNDKETFTSYFLDQDISFSLGTFASDAVLSQNPCLKG